jgi:glycosyltransferase involved in cell wall biosynthesis
MGFFEDCYFHFEDEKNLSAKRITETSRRNIYVIYVIVRKYDEPAPPSDRRKAGVSFGWPLGRLSEIFLRMYRGQKVIVVMPAYNAARTLRQTYDEVRAQGLVDLIILVDDKSRDETVAIARQLEGVKVHAHTENKGYGGNQKSCYRLALREGADIVIMIHPDYQYTPKLIPAMVSIIANGLHPCVLGSRILGGYALKGGMPPWKYIANRFLTLAENLLLGAKLSEYHTGYRAFSRKILETLLWDVNSDDFIFDNQMLAQIFWHGYTIGEVSCPTKYFKEASSINFRRSLKYGFGCLAVGLAFRLAKLGLLQSRLFPPTVRPVAKG